MLRLLIALAILAPSAALAGNNACQWNPPASYSGKPTSPYKIVRLSQPKVQQICEKGLRALGLTVEKDYRGCALPGKTWKVYVVRGGYKCATEAAIVRHELGHVSGWPANHPH